jgi:hypothetical protein
MPPGGIAMFCEQFLFTREAAKEGLAACVEKRAPKFKGE